MKSLIVLALLSVAFATPIFEPIVLPEAPEPAYEVPVSVPVVLVPAIEVYDAQPIIEIADISPVIIPKEISDRLNAFGELIDFNGEVVQFVDNAEDSDADIPADDVIVVDQADEVAPVEDVAEDVVDPVQVVDEVPENPEAVNFVDEAENVEYAPLDAVDDTGALEKVQLDDNFELPAEDVEEPAADPVNFVDEAENVEYAPLDAVDDSSAPETVQFVDNFELPSEDAEEPAADPVNFVDVAENVEYAPLDGEAVIVVDQAEEISPLNIVDDAIFSERLQVADEFDVPSEDVEEPAAEPVNFVDDAENVEYAPLDGEVVNVVDQAEDAPEPVQVVDTAVPNDWRQIISLLKDQLEVKEQTVQVVDAPIYPPKQYDDPMWR